MWNFTFLIVLAYNLSILIQIDNERGVVMVLASSVYIMFVAFFHIKLSLFKCHTNYSTLNNSSHTPKVMLLMKITYLGLRFMCVYLLLVAIYLLHNLSWTILYLFFSLNALIHFPLYLIHEKGKHQKSLWNTFFNTVTRFT